MGSHAAHYIEHLKDRVRRKIDVELSANRARAVAKAVVAFHFTDVQSLAFQNYYIEIVENENNFLTSDDFFPKFKKMYALQGIDNAHLDRLGAAKKIILDNLKADELTSLYLAHFAQVSIKYGDRCRLKDLGSFFSKLTHTFKPSEYCALDNPIKKYFGLANEGFYVSFIAISSAYKGWIQENSKPMKELRRQLDAHPIGRDYTDKMTDLKLLDLVFWLRANKPGVLSV